MLRMARKFEGVIFDRDELPLKMLRKLGFRPTAVEDEYFRVQDFVYGKMSDVATLELKEIRKDVRTWKNQLQHLLSRPVGKYAHKRRPHRNQFPMLNSGALRNSLYVDVKLTEQKKLWIYELKAGFKGVGDRHATLTNENITRAGRNARKVAWFNWWNNVMDGEHSKRITSVRQLMHDVF